MTFPAHLTTSAAFTMALLKFQAQCGVSSALSKAISDSFQLDERWLTVFAEVGPDGWSYTWTIDGEAVSEEQVVEEMIKAPELGALAHQQRFKI